MLNNHQNSIDFFVSFRSDVSCPEDFVYSQCHEGCPQTCSTVKNKTIDSKCDELKIDGCFCPEGKVLRDGTCVDTVLCGRVYLLY